MPNNQLQRQKYARQNQIDGRRNFNQSNSHTETPRNFNPNYGKRKNFLKSPNSNQYNSQPNNQKKYRNSNPTGSKKSSNNIDYNSIAEKVADKLKKNINGNKEELFETEVFLGYYEDIFNNTENITIFITDFLRS